VAFAVNFLEPTGFEDRIAELLHAWDTNGSFEFYTSGSTGAPKKLTFTKHQISQSANATALHLSLERNREHFFLCLDPNFIAGAMMVLRARFLDCPISICKPSSEVWQKMQAQHNFTFASFVPLQILSNQFDKDKFKQFKNVLIGGSGLTADVMERVKELGNHVYHTYGMTETLTHVALMDINHATAYKALEGYNIALSNMGTLNLQVPFLDRTIETNDLAIFNNNNEFEILGRTDFIINSGAYKVNPEKVEAAIKVLLPYQVNCLVFGIADNKLGEKVWVLFERDIEDDLFNEIQKKLLLQLHKYEVPKGKSVFGPFILTKSGKLDRREIIKHLIIS